MCELFHTRAGRILSHSTLKFIAFPLLEAALGCGYRRRLSRPFPASRMSQFVSKRSQDPQTRRASERDARANSKARLQESRASVAG